ncbi:MAG TPA: rRNA pseudouridine synthase [Candidatus Avacidaminococcus intestinavium]|uniref:Pseudouridine synthase n=1 Tax=Candidatus Avacidaminococcus intestinavium TaxID=2840684 RepID=A0A9D1MR36_9FIRM|nr:rRNA pseudouridine synthase [Candidatus Avacidaminococcus intestinavium]
MEERLQKILASAGVASRREAEKIILEGRVKVNGKLIKEVGLKFKKTAYITVDGKPIRQEKKIYLIFNKPRGVVTTMQDPEKRKCIADFVKDLDERVYPVGRLDYNTEGLLILTNDGTLAQALMHPSNEIPKSYRVAAVGIIPQEKLDQLRIGVKLEDGLTAPAMVDLIAYDNEKNLTYFNIVIHEGRNRQIRRMCDFIGFPVRQLKRFKIANLTLNGLVKGKFRELHPAELKVLMKAVGLDE